MTSTYFLNIILVMEGFEFLITNDLVNELIRLFLRQS